MCGMAVRDMVSEWLEGNGYGGLYSKAGCACTLADLAPCDEMGQGCEAAYRFDCCRCAKRLTCDDARQVQEWLVSPSRDFCAPDYVGDVPAAGLASQGSALPACVPLTIGEIVHVAGHPDWQGIGEAPEGALKAEPGEVFIPIADAAEAKAIKDSAPKPRPAALAMPLPAKEVCQKTAKSEPVVSIESDAITALRHVNKCFLQLGA